MAAPARSGDRSGLSEIGWLVLLGAIWGSAFPVIRAGLVAGASPTSYGAARFTLAMVAMALIAIATRDPWPDRRTVTLSALYGGMLMIGGYTAFLYTGEEYISGGLASIFVATAPLSSALVARFLLPSERLGRAGLLGLVTGFAGVLVLLLPGTSGGGFRSLVGGVLAFLAALLYALGAVLLRRSLSSATRPWGLTVQFGTAAAVLGVACVTPVGSAHLPLNSGVVLTLVWLVIMPSVVGYTIFFRLHHRVGPTRASLVAYVNPVVGVLVGIGVFGERVTINEVAGFLFVIAGLYLLLRDRSRMAPDPRPPHETRARDRDATEEVPDPKRDALG